MRQYKGGCGSDCDFHSIPDAQFPGNQIVTTPSNLTVQNLLGDKQIERTDQYLLGYNMVAP